MDAKLATEIAEYCYPDDAEAAEKFRDDVIRDIEKSADRVQGLYWVTGSPADMLVLDPDAARNDVSAVFRGGPYSPDPYVTAEWNQLTYLGSAMAAYAVVNAFLSGKAISELGEHAEIIVRSYLIDMVMMKTPDALELIEVPLEAPGN